MENEKYTSIVERKGQNQTILGLKYIYLLLGWQQTYQPKSDYFRIEI